MSDVLDKTAPSLPPSLGADTYPEVGTRKIFTKPFRLVFKRTSDQAITWIEVKSLRGLRNVVERLGKGELVPVNAYATLDRQLWGLLAEHVGFLRYTGPVGHLDAGIEPLGPEQADLVGDMEELFGGFEPAIQALSDMRDGAIKVAMSGTEGGPTFLKGDGVNLTPEGEKELASIVYDSVGQANVSVKMETANAEILLQETDTEDSPIGDAIAEIDAQGRDLVTITGEEADAIGRKVEAAAEGNLEDEEEVND